MKFTIPGRARPAFFSPAASAGFFFVTSAKQYPIPPARPNRHHRYSLRQSHLRRLLQPRHLLNFIGLQLSPPLRVPQFPLTNFPFAKFLLTLFLLALMSGSPSAWAQSLPLSKPLQQITLGIGQSSITAEVADTESTRALGLMYRQHMPDEAGMLFVFEQPKMPCFWMKNTYIPLSIAFITATGQISSILSMEPERTDPHCPIEPILYALEVNQGWFERNGIQAGDKITGLPSNSGQ